MGAASGQASVKLASVSVAESIALLKAAVMVLVLGATSSAPATGVTTVTVGGVTTTGSMSPPPRMGDCPSPPQAARTRLSTVAVSHGVSLKLVLMFFICLPL